jgi:hypothetical protein
MLMPSDVTLLPCELDLGLAKPMIMHVNAKYLKSDGSQTNRDFQDFGAPWNILMSE